MKLLLRLEGLGILIAAITLYHYAGYSWWLFAALLLTPDIGMLGYVVSTKLGAITYNLFHHLLIAVIVVLLGYFCDINYMFLYGLIMVAHIGMDRLFGYGLKYQDHFKNTHLDKL